MINIPLLAKLSAIPTVAGIALIHEYEVVFAEGDLLAAAATLAATGFERKRVTGTSAIFMERRTNGANERIAVCPKPLPGTSGAMGRVTSVLAVETEEQFSIVKAAARDNVDGITIVEESLHEGVSAEILVRDRALPGDLRIVWRRWPIFDGLFPA